MTRTGIHARSFSPESMRRIEEALVVAGFSDENLDDLLKEIEFIGAKKGVTAPMRREGSPRPAR